MTLADFTSPRLIIPELQGADVATVLQELSQALHRGERVPDFAPFYEAALNRESLVSTDTEAGIAFPHARLAGVKEVSFALGRHEKSLRWSAKALSSVRLVFLIAVPSNESMQYLSLISGLVRLAKDPDLPQTLFAATDCLEMFKVLEQVKLRTNPARKPVEAAGR